MERSGGCGPGRRTILPARPPSRPGYCVRVSASSNGADASYDFDLFTIGAGSGGVRGSRFASSYGAKVAVCEMPFDFISSGTKVGRRPSLLRPTRSPCTATYARISCVSAGSEGLPACVPVARGLPVLLCRRHGVKAATPRRWPALLRCKHSNIKCSSCRLPAQGGVGGTCVLRGCVPKKLMVYASEYAEEFKAAEGFG
jgi:hypothetical protein